MKKIWFRRKRYGWGWYPATWQGWMILLGYIIVIGAIITIRQTHPESSGNVFKFIVEIVIATLVLIAVCYATGESPKWRWGNRDDEK